MDTQVCLSSVCLALREVSSSRSRPSPSPRRRVSARSWTGPSPGSDSTARTRFDQVGLPEIFRYLTIGHQRRADDEPAEGWDQDRARRLANFNALVGSPHRFLVR